MQSAKMEVSKLIDTLPDDCSLDDIQYHLYVLQKVERGLKDGEAGRTFTQEEVGKRAAKWLDK
jgi:predicted transcriptional regulator